LTQVNECDTHFYIVATMKHTRLAEQSHPEDTPLIQ